MKHASSSCIGHRHPFATSAMPPFVPVLCGRPVTGAGTDAATTGLMAAGCPPAVAMCMSDRAGSRYGTAGDLYRGIGFGAEGILSLHRAGQDLPDSHRAHGALLHLETLQGRAVRAIAWRQWSAASSRVPHPVHGRYRHVIMGGQIVFSSLSAATRSHFPQPTGRLPHRNHRESLFP